MLTYVDPVFQEWWTSKDKMYTSVLQGGFKTFTDNLAVYCECVSRNEQGLVVAGGRGHSMNWDKVTSAKPHENSKLHDCQSLIFGHFFPGIAWPTAISTKFN